MKIQDIIVSKDYHFKKIECIMASPEKTPKTKNLTGIVTLQSNNKLCFETDKDHFIFTIRKKEDEMLILQKISRNLNCLAFSEKVVTKDSFYLDIKFFPRTVDFRKLDVLLSDDVLKTLREADILNKGKIDKNDFASLVNEFSIKSIYNEYFLCSLGYDEVESAFDKELKDINLYSNNLSISISIEDDIAVAKKITIGKIKNIKTVILGLGKLSFVTEHLMISNKVKELLKDNNEYMRIWDEYSNREGDFLLKHARNVGYLITNENSSFNNSKLTIGVRKSQNLDFLVIGDQLSFVDDLPIYLEDENMNWAEYRKYNKQLEKESKSNRQQSYAIVSLDKENNYITLDTNDISITSKKYAILNISGNETQISRRENAKLSISSGNCAMPTLGLILEGRVDSVSLTKKNNSKKIEPLSVHVKEKIFKHDPTDTQKKAIEIALNTPDIAIIQGPPGTGKTTVITAIIERLNEMFDKRESIKGQILVTSFQHDAVENVIERLRINSLPTIKFGKKGNGEDGEDGVQYTEKLIKEWRDETTKNIKDKNIQIKETENLSDFNKAFEFYKNYPTSANEKQFLEIAKKVTTNIELLEEIDSMLEKFQLQDKVITNDIYKDVLRLRVKSNSYNDDGSKNLMNLYNSLENILSNSTKENQEILDILREIYMAGENISKDQLKQLKQIRLNLLKILKPAPTYKVEEENPEITELYSRIKKGQHGKNEVDELLLEFLRELDTNHDKIKTALNDYSFVYASSMQQAAGQEISKVKTSKTEKQVVYDTVIVDEAARANPGDLLIPLAQARNKIILVGDQRQLPHIYSEEIVKEMEKDDDNFDLPNIKVSMFQKLMEIGKKLQSEDGIKRTITLDAQYRMHPLLGNFVCENFYSNHNEFFSSPLPESLFEQKLMSSPANWIDVNLSKGDEKKFNSSRTRIAEIDVIISKIEEITSNPESSDLSIGVISFYSAQKKEIEKRLKASLPDISESKIRVGSVDAFQGMEFDIIFLSIVRTSAILNKVDNNNLTEQMADKAFGFMKIENRLCVAMSRQKRILIAVGDARLFQSELAQKYVPALKNYYELCKSNGGVFSV